MLFELFRISECTNLDFTGLTGINSYLLPTYIFVRYRKMLNNPTTAFHSTLSQFQLCILSHRSAWLVPFTFPYFQKVSRMKDFFRLLFHIKILSRWVQYHKVMGIIKKIKKNQQNKQQTYKPD